MRGVKENLEEKVVARIPRRGVESTNKAREYKSLFPLVCHVRRKRKPLEKKMACGEIYLWSCSMD